MTNDQMEIMAAHTNAVAKQLLGRILLGVCVSFTGIMLTIILSMYTVIAVLNTCP